MVWRGSTTPQDRLFACLPYLLVLIYAAPFGSFFLELLPPVEILFNALLAPLYALYGLVPFGDLIIFIALLLLVVRNDRILHFIRFNTMQALLISLVLYLGSLLMRILADVPGLSSLQEIVANTIFLGGLGMFGYAVVQCVRGMYAEIPAVSEAAYSQTR